MKITKKELKQIIEQELEELKYIPKGGGSTYDCGEVGALMGAEFATKDYGNSRRIVKSLDKEEQLSPKAYEKLEIGFQNAKRELAKTGKYSACFSSETESGFESQMFKSFVEGFLKKVEEDILHMAKPVKRKAGDRLKKKSKHGDAAEWERARDWDDEDTVSRGGVGRSTYRPRSAADRERARFGRGSVLGVDPRYLEEGMPSSVAKHKQKLADMSDEEFAEKHGDKSEEQLRQMAWRHGYGKMSPHYLNRVKKTKDITKEELEQIVEEEFEAVFNESNRDDRIFQDLKALVSGLNMMSQRDKNNIIGQAERARAAGSDKVKINIWIARTLAKAFPRASSVQTRLDKIMSESVKSIEESLRVFQEDGDLDETLDSVPFPPVNKPTKKCPEGHTVSKKTGECEPLRPRPRMSEESK